MINCECFFLEITSSEVILSLLRLFLFSAQCLLWLLFCPLTKSASSTSCFSYPIHHNTEFFIGKLVFWLVEVQWGCHNHLSKKCSDEHTERNLVKINELIPHRILKTCKNAETADISLFIFAIISGLNFLLKSHKIL